MKKNKKKKNIDLQARRERIENAKTMGKSLFSNQAAIDAGTHNPWWAALIIFLVAVFLPIIPMLTSGLTAAGSDMVANNVYGLDIATTRFVNDMNEKGINLTVNENFQLIDTGDKWKTSEGFGDSDTLQYNHVKTYDVTDKDNNVTEANEYDLLAYYSTKLDDDFTTFAENLGKRSYVKGTTTLYVESEQTPAEGEEKPEPVQTYKPNLIIMNRQRFMISIFNGTNNYITGMTGDYLKFEPGYTMVSIAATGIEDKSETNLAYANATFNNFKGFLDTSFLHTRNMSTMVSTLTAAGIYVGLGFFMGLMIFLLTRGKRNINRRLSFLACQKIQAWSMFTPAILGMILGFIVPNGAIMFFIIFLGVRIMWMSMKQLRPVMR